MVLVVLFHLIYADVATADWIVDTTIDVTVHRAVDSVDLTTVHMMTAGLVVDVVRGIDSDTVDSDGGSKSLSAADALSCTTHSVFVDDYIVCDRSWWKPNSN